MKRIMLILILLPALALQAQVKIAILQMDNKTQLFGGTGYLAGQEVHLKDTTVQFRLTHKVTSIMSMKTVFDSSWYEIMGGGSGSEGDTSLLVHKTRIISTTSPLRGGGNLSVNRTFYIDTDTLIVWWAKQNHGEIAYGWGDWHHTTISGYGITDIVNFPGFGTLHSKAAYGDHNHAGLYSLLNHTHAISDVTGLQNALDAKGGDSLYRYTAYSSGDMNVEVLATGTGITVALANTNEFTFTIPANIKMVSVKMRIDRLASVVCFVGTGDYAGRVMATRWMPIVQAWREDTGGQLMGANCGMSIADFTRFTINGLISTTKCQIRLAF